MKAIVPKGFGAPLGMYSHGVVASAGELVVVAGQVGMTATGAVAVDDIVAQTKQAFENVRASLRPQAPIVIVINDRRDLYPEILERAGLGIKTRYQRHVNRRTGRRAGEFYEDVIVAS